MLLSKSALPRIIAFSECLRYFQTELGSWIFLCNFLLSKYESQDMMAQHIYFSVPLSITSICLLPFYLVKSQRVSWLLWSFLELIPFDSKLQPQLFKWCFKVIFFFSTPGLNPFLLSIRLRERWDENEEKGANGEGRRVIELLCLLSKLTTDPLQSWSQTDKGKQKTEKTLIKSVSSRCL